MALSPFMAAINQIADEKGLDKDTIIGTVESAIAAAYRKDYGKPRQVIKVTMDPETAEFKVFQVFTVVEEVENEEAELTLSGAQKFKKKSEVGDEITIPLPFHDDFGRIAAQTAKQVVIQRLREAERNVIYGEYKDKEGEIVPGTVQQMEGTTIVINLGKSNALMLPSDQIRHEHYYVGQRLRVYIKAVEESPKGPRILVSRADPRLIEGLFTLEVPEIQSGGVLLKGVAREAGDRSKVAVTATNESIDPVGSAVGQRGTRIQAILAELGEEKIDIILWDENPAQFISNALSPARIDEVQIDVKNNTAKVFAAEDQLSLAIGKNGQNVRLAGKLTGYEIDIVRTGDTDRSDREKGKIDETETKEESKKETKADTKTKSKKTTEKPEPDTKEVKVDEKPAEIETKQEATVPEEESGK
jgi:N utilization substance protein A